MPLGKSGTSLAPLLPLIALVLSGCLRPSPAADIPSAPVEGVGVEILSGPSVARSEYGSTVWHFRAINRGTGIWDYIASCGPREPWTFELFGIRDRWLDDSPALVVDCFEYDRAQLRPGDAVAGNFSWRKTWWSSSRDRYEEVPAGDYALVVSFWMSKGSAQARVNGTAEFAFQPV